MDVGSKVIGTGHARNRIGEATVLSVNNATRHVNISFASAFGQKEVRTVPMFWLMDLPTPSSAVFTGQVIAGKSSGGGYTPQPPVDTPSLPY